MRSLSDHIDILNRNTKNIKSVTQHSVANSGFSGPFTQAILHSHLGDLIRDVDPSELGLFTLVQPERTSARDRHTITSSAIEIERINFNGPIPLKRHNTRNDDTLKPRDADPEVYAEAALKYMDRYKLVRPMPRAQQQIQVILDRAPIIRQSIEALKDRLYNMEQTAKTSEVRDLKAQVEQEEQLIKELRSRATDLTKRLAHNKAKRSHLDLPENRGVADKSFTTIQPKAEDEFWGTPAASTRTLQFSDNLLMDEKADFEDISALSFSASPTFLRIAPSCPTDTTREIYVDLQDKQGASTFARDGDTKISPSGIQKYPPASPPIPETKSTSPTMRSNLPSLGHDGLGNLLTESKWMIPITQEVDVITSRIWAVMNDLVTAAAAATEKIELQSKPLSRDLIDYLERMSQITPIDNILTATTATNAAPSLQQILTASLLTSLLLSPHNYSLPLTKVKEMLASQIDTNVDSKVNPSQSSSRIIYGCVAKRLLRIDRTAGEQIVRFDV